MADRIFDLLKDLTDNDTLIIVGLLVIAVIYGNESNTITAIVSGFLGYMKGRNQETQPSVVKE